MLRTPTPSTAQHGRQLPLRLSPGARLARCTQLRAQVQVQEVATADAPAAAEGSGCPVLNSLRSPPPYAMNPVEDFLLARSNPTEHRVRSQGGKPLASTRFLGMLPSVMVGSTSLLKEVLSQEAAGKLVTAWPRSTHLLLGEESLTVVKDPAHHRFLRQVLLGAMSAEAVAGYLPQVHDICTGTLEHWADECEGTGSTVTALDGLKSMTIQVISSLVMDMRLNRQELAEVGHDFNIWIKPLFSLYPYDVWPMPFYFAMRARERLVARIEERLARLKQEMASGQLPERPVSMLHRLVTEKDETGQSLSHKEVVDNLLNTLFAGHDTTSSYLCAMMYFLATRPEMLERIRAEQQRVVARHGPRMTPAALKDMWYTQAVLSEVIRLKPLVAIVPRKAKEDIPVGEYKVDAGTTMLLHYGYMSQTDPRWPADGTPDTNPLHPANFNPDRFMTEEGAKQGAQLPFGAGIRTCAGMSLATAEAKVFLATLARGYQYVADTNTKWMQRPILRPENSLPIYLTRLPASQRVV